MKCDLSMAKFDSTQLSTFALPRRKVVTRLVRKEKKRGEFLFLLGDKDGKFCLFEKGFENWLG